MDSRKCHTIVLAEPSPLLSSGFSAVISAYSDLRIAEKVADLHFLTDVMQRHSPDILVVDPLIADSGSRMAFRSMLPDGCRASVVALCPVLFDEGVLSQFDAVISIYDQPSVIARKLRKSAEQSPQEKHGGGYDLSDREKEILVAVARGRTNKEIADEFCISVHTVISHRKNITQKTGIKSIAGLTVYAMLNNLISIDDGL